MHLEKKQCGKGGDPIIIKGQVNLKAGVLLGDKKERERAPNNK